MNGTASPGPTATSSAIPKADTVDPDSGDDSSLDDLSSLSSGDEEALLDELGPSIIAVTRHEPKPDNDDEDGAHNNQDDQTDVKVDGTEQDTVNGHGADDSLNDERPAKRQRTRASTPPPHPSSARKPKTISPPWKKALADGPSSFSEGGRRKSGRINFVPLELQPGEKRITRRAVHDQTSPPSAKTGAVNGHATQLSNSPSIPISASISARRPSTTTRTPVSSSSSRNTQQQPQNSSSRHQPSRRSAAAADPRTSTPSSNRLQRSSTSASSPPKKASHATATPGSRSQPSRSSRNARPSRDAASAVRQEMPTRTTPRIRLRTRTLTIPIVHPDQIKLKPKLAPTLREYFELAETVPVEEGGLFASEDEPRMTDEMAAREAAVIMRIEQETEEGGILTAPRCVAFEPEAAEEPARQWAHNDHMIKAVANFRRLLGMEQQRHRAVAKRLAEACRDEWARRQPKSVEQLEAEARSMWIGRYRVVMRALFGTWENVRLEINRRRLREWEAEEQRRVKAALQEAVARSEQKLQARRVQQDSEALSDEDMDDEELDDDELDDLDDDEAGLETLLDAGNATADDDDDADADDDDEEDEDDDDESNMSSSEDEDDQEQTKEDVKLVESDEGLTQDQLRQKYADLPPLEAALDKTENNKDRNSDSESDESVDMDDDLGSSEMDSDDDDNEGSDDSDEADGSDGDNATSDEDDNQQASGLLGMLFGKSELKKLKVEPVEDEAMPLEIPLSEVTPDTKEPAALTNGHINAVTANGAQSMAAYTNGHTIEEDDDDDVAMVDMPPADEPIDEAASPLELSQVVPNVAVTASTTDDDKPASTPGTDAFMTVASPGRTQSPNTLDTKPSDLDTPISGSVESGENDESIENIENVENSENTENAANTDKLLDAPKEISASRSVSQAPTTATVATATAATPKTEIPFLLRGTLRAYQHYGLDWLAGLYANRTNGILADEMGLGKTIQTIALLAHLACHHEVWGPHLVIVPTSVILNWEMEFKKWCPSFKILTYYGSQEERKRKRVGWTNDDIWNVCITSYQIVVQDQQVFKRRRWHYMILDEAHNIKNFKSQRWQSLLGFNTHARLLLTGTPLQNNLTELWSLLFFLMPPENGVGGFADLSEFHDWFHKPESQILESGREEMDEEARAIISKLHKVLRPYLLRRLKADVEKQMPAKYEHVELCRLSKRQRELYDGFLARSDTRATLSSGNYLSIINCLMQLRKVCNHPDLFVDRPIMTSFRMQRSIPAGYEAANDDVMQRRLLIGGNKNSSYERGRVNLQVLNLVPTVHETGLSAGVAVRINQLATNRVLADLKEAQRARLPHPFPELDASTVKSSLTYLENGVRWKRFEELQHAAYLNALRRQRRPVYGKGLLDMLTLGAQERPFKPRPKVPAQIMAWFENDSFLLHNLVQPLQRRSASYEMTITKFACVTPAVVTRDMNAVLLGRQGAEAFEDCDLRLSAPVKRLPFMERQPPRDPWHEARMRLTIQFPDKRLLQYDCGKLQALDRLLRRLQAGGHRALIFTQMTKVLDILEQFLNIHGHKYLRLDGATKIEQRQILTDRFNNDNRILCFILSTRSGGLGINLTGADTVIFYDQDWNPAMDKQCQDRCHRIGQTRDVHIYRLVSEHTIEANILRKASQKQMLDDVVIQEGEFTTDYFNKMTVKDVLADEDKEEVTDGFRESDAVASAAMERVLGGVETAGDQRIAGRVLEQAEDREDVAAARLAEKEILQDDADFSEKPSAAATSTAATGTATATASGVSTLQGTPREGSALPPTNPLLDAIAEAVGESVAAPDTNAWGTPMHNIDEYMLGWMGVMLQGTALELPKDRKKSKKKRGKDTRKR
ncbi:helicase swr1 [Ophiostoma piceae UAMH 11346]|uniref:DNA helicase n=1 Tax=Ophiostoma piceae (strain UAMH 11346) TaxID=1262450 RepID=S3CKI1_OPHP1|nr:helicase swr1 [Ophiostoma piceae UAMH 11346]